MAESRVPPASGAVWPVGHALTLLRDPLGFLSSLANDGSELVKIRIGPGAAVVVCDPDLADRVLRDDRTFDKGGPLFDTARKVVGDNVITCPHRIHRRQRSLIQPTFGRARLANYGRAMTAEADAMTAAWSDGAVVDMLAETLRLATHTVMATMFSGALAPRVRDRALADVTVIVDGLYRQMLAPPLLNRLPTPGNRRYGRAHVRLRELMAGIVADRRIDGTDHGDLVSAMLSARLPTETAAPADIGSGMTDSQICDQLMAFFIAGSETTASALAWALHLLVAHPEIEERLHQETARVLDGAPARYRDLPDLPLTGHIITEALRLYPPGWLFTRTVTTDTRLGRYDLPAGTSVVYSPYILHRRNDLYRDPNRFDPDRWDTPQPPIQRKAFVAFGAGPRRCPGEAFAITELSLALATIAGRWRIRHRVGTPARPAVAMALHPRDLRIRVQSARCGGASPSAGGHR
ncbi:cytochrome P450 [Nocardia zapadnayensis]|uniref:cytochrome P450 n=1 Tax=Nocardia rhamnosiphila TaxID=426716 RepID=UPI002245A38F|nr:cytochrome P450 [Nocardia zapadnayensis]MCX0274888.1 cytochrome P450 [Nocardia zapadnayensis]